MYACAWGGGEESGDGAWPRPNASARVGEAAAAAAAAEEEAEAFGGECDGMLLTFISTDDSSPFFGMRRRIG